MSISKLMLGSFAACLCILASASQAHSEVGQGPQRLELKHTQDHGAGGALGALSVALEVPAHQPEVTGGIRATLVVNNRGSEPVEFLDVRDSAQLQLQTATGRALRPAPALPASLVHIPGRRGPETVRLAAGESFSAAIGVTQVLDERESSESGSRPKLVPVPAGAYRIRASLRLISAHGAPGDRRASAAFESEWGTVVLGEK